MNKFYIFAIKRLDVICKHLKTKIVFFCVRNRYDNTNFSCNTLVFHAAASLINQDYG